jgi:hypothetical protein
MIEESPPLKSAFQRDHERRVNAMCDAYMKNGGSPKAQEAMIWAMRSIVKDKSHKEYWVAVDALKQLGKTA